MSEITVKVNGQIYRLNVDPDRPLLWVLREDLGLTGTKFGCGIGQCGACMVHVDGTPARSCSTSIESVSNKTVLTIEGLSDDGKHPVQRAWKKMDVPQCGYCQSGQIMSAVALLKKHPKPTNQAINKAMAGNLCRCGAYQGIRDAIHLAADLLQE